MTAVTEDATGAATELPRLLPPPEHKKDAHDWRAHVDRHGALPYRDRQGILIGDIEAAGLTGRGGAAFPVHRKLQAVAEAARRRRRPPAVIANGAESEPASDKDATLLWLSPHLVLDGLQLAAEAVGADTAILYTHVNRGHDVGSRLRDALLARQAAGVDRVPVQLAAAPARFLSGQETALLNHLSGGPAIPTFTPPRITERGLGGAPTLVQNAETLAHLALIARKGPGWFRGVGTKAEPGSMLATVRRPDGRPRISEIPLGLPLKDLLDGLNQPSVGQPIVSQHGVGQRGAVLIGGYHGTWLSANEARGLTLDNHSLARAHARLGAGVVIELPPDRCGLVETARVVRYLALESAGQCGPCLNGLPRIAAALGELAWVNGKRPRPQLIADIQRWSGLVTGRGACHHPDGTTRLVWSALRTFAPEVDLHRRGLCAATDTRAFLPVPRDSARTEEDWI